VNFPPDISDSNVLRAMQTVPRHRFIPPHLASEAGGDYPLPIGYGQTISQPYIVAIMSQALGVGPGDRVLEIGTGSGYQAAVLAAMGCQVYSVEIIPELAKQSRAVLDELAYDVTVITGDGHHGWKEHAPYDGIIVTAAPVMPPPALLEQLKPGAALIVPVGPPNRTQTLWRITVGDDGKAKRQKLADVRFVPFTRSNGDQAQSSP
jgi:protein-L-isoaspartate(D-aspartate) O-methyltransferase